MKSRTLAAMVLAAAVAVTAAGCASSASSSSSSSAPAACGPLVAIIGYVMPVLDQAAPQRIVTSGGTITPAPKYPWQDAASEVYDAGQFAPAALSLDAGTVANGIGSLGAGLPAATWQPILRTALGKIRAACPALPASVVNGPLPR